MPSVRRTRIAIIGAGLSGLTLAHGLRKTGADVLVLERDSSANARGQGYRLTIDEHGDDALRRCLPAHLYDTARRTGGKPGHAFMFLDRRGCERFRMTFPKTSRDSMRHRQADRLTLRRILLTGLDDRVHFGKCLVSVECSPRKACALFGDGSEVEADVLVGADGANSMVRKRCFPHVRVHDTGSQAIFGRTLLTERLGDAFGGRLHKGGLMEVGRRGSVFFCTAMQFEESPAQFGLPAREDYIMWAITLPNRRLPDDEGGSLDFKRLLDVALAESHQFSADCSHLLRSAEADDTLLVPLRTTHRLTSSSPLPITLIGDAMHTMPPFGANGANTALRDSDLLTRRLRAVFDGVPAAQVLQEYESEMRAYANPVVRSSTQMMASMTSENPLMHLLVMQGLNIAAVIARGK